MRAVLAHEDRRGLSMSVGRRHGGKVEDGRSGQRDGETVGHKRSRGVVRRVDVLLGLFSALVERGNGVRESVLGRQIMNPSRQAHKHLHTCAHRRYQSPCLR